MKLLKQGSTCSVEDRGLIEPWKEAFCGCLPLEAPSQGILMGLKDLRSGKRQKEQGNCCKGVELLLLPQVGVVGMAGSDKSKVICIFLLWQREIKDVYIRKSVIWIIGMSACPNATEPKKTNNQKNKKPKHHQQKKKEEKKNRKNQPTNEFRQLEWRNIIISNKQLTFHKYLQFFFSPLCFLFFCQQQATGWLVFLLVIFLPVMYFVLCVLEFDFFHFLLILAASLMKISESVGTKKWGETIKPYSKDICILLTWILTKKRNGL